jgi:hypothetical protein
MNLRATFVVLCMVSMLGSCSQAFRDSYDNGVGTELAHSSIGQQTTAQNAYVSSICQQTGDGCGDWKTFTYAGMNDIDARCDAYLAWLDSRRRWNGPIQKQIADTSTATTTIMAFTGAGAVAIGVVAAAFGFTRNSFDNAQSRLLMEVNHSTVQTIVLSNQDRFRKQVATADIVSRPVAIYALRQYLRLCMPFTIENEINTTITTYQLGGARALEAAEENPLIRLAAVQRQAITPQRIVYRPPGKIFTKQYSLVVKNPQQVSPPIIQRALGAICATSEEIAEPTRVTSAHVKVLQQWRKIRSRLPDKRLDGKMDEGDLAVASAEPPCTANARNFYEMKEYPGGVKTYAVDIAELLNKKLTGSERLSDNPEEPAMRAAIALVRAKMKDELQLNDQALSEELTLELVSKLDGIR